jgi:nitrile hydratase
MSPAAVSPRRFAPGDRVTVVYTHPPGHRRIPSYIRGKSGLVERYCGAFPNPEELAYGFDGLPARHLYRVRFQQTAIDLQKMNQKFRTGLHEHTGVSLKERLPKNPREGYTRVHQDTAQSRDHQRPPPPSSASLSTR